MFANNLLVPRDILIKEKDGLLEKAEVDLKNIEEGMLNSPLVIKGISVERVDQIQRLLSAYREADQAKQSPSGHQDDYGRGRGAVGARRDGASRAS